MTSTEYQPVVVDSAPEQAREQGEQAGLEPVAEVVDVAELVDAAEPVESAVDVAEGIGAPLLVSFVGAMALVVAVLTPVAGARIGALVTVGAAVLLVCRLLARRGGGVR